MSTTDTNESRFAEPPRVRPRSDSARQRSERRERLTGRNERIGIYAAVVLAAGAAALAPTMIVPVEPIAGVLRAVFAALVVLAGSRARRWSWLVLGGMAVLFSEDAIWLGVAGVGIGVAFASTFLTRRRVYGAVSVGFSVQPLFWMPELGSTYLAGAIGVLAVAPVLVSAYFVSPRRIRARVLRAAAVAIGCFVAGALLAGIGALLAYGDATNARESARSGLDRAQEGDTTAAAAQLREAEESFARAHSVFSAPWISPALIVPGVAQQVDAIKTVAAQGQEVAAATALVAEEVDYEGLKYTDGSVDLEALRDAQVPLAGAATVIEVAAGEVSQVEGSLLLPPLARAVEAFSDDLDEAAPQAAIASFAIELAPGLLGADGPRRYAVLFTTPAELRGLGGFVGSWAILEARDGEVELVDTIRTADLNTEAGREERSVSTEGDLDDESKARLDDYLARYARFRPGYYLQDVTFSPDLPTVGEAVVQLLPQAGQDAIDGVIVADPYGLAALLELTGPVRAEGLDEPIDADNVAEFLVRDQYTMFPDRDARADYLGEVGEEVFRRLVKGSLPSPERLGETLGPAVREGRLGMWTVDDEEAGLLADIGADGSFARPDGGDFLSVRTQNKGNNKIDAYVTRAIDHSVLFDPATGEVQSTVAIELTNGATSLGLPPAVVGSNDQGLETGLNRSYLSVYTPLALQSAHLDGERVGLESQRELGYHAYSTYVDIPAGETVRIELDLTGTIDSDGYELTVDPQPMVEPDSLVLSVDPVEGWSILDAETSERIAVSTELGGARAIGRAELAEKQSVTIRFSQE